MAPDTSSSTSRYASGRGPGVVTLDGCAVDLYALLPPGRAEADIVVAVAPKGATVLELGSGAGRVTHCLVERGFAVVAVDESPEMLDRVRGAEIVTSTIEALDLHRRFDVVLLASHLINVPDDDAAAALLASCARHVAADGEVLIERHPVRWFDEALETEVERDGIVYGLRDVVRTEPDTITATAHYRIGDRVWTQTFTTRSVDDVRLRELLTDAGLELIGFADADRAWARARPLLP
jgi:SAM-dependent methyltransferase